MIMIAVMMIVLMIVKAMMIIIMLVFQSTWCTALTSSSTCQTTSIQCLHQKLHHYNLLLGFEDNPSCQISLLTCCLMSETRQLGNLSMLPRFLKRGTMTSSENWQKCSATKTSSVFKSNNFLKLEKVCQCSTRPAFPYLPRALGQTSPTATSLRRSSFASLGERPDSIRVNGACRKRRTFLSDHPLGKVNVFYPRILWEK